VHHDGAQEVHTHQEFTIFSVFLKFWDQYQANDPPIPFPEYKNRGLLGSQHRTPSVHSHHPN
jgi:hypothetical protein